ncbi:MAG: replication initiation protein, partial [Peptostreptococcaceae bacterium]|nr:replication initiation protein [Peptostreptococcaceae bacterium]
EVKELHSGNVNSTLQEVKKVHGSNTNINYPDYREPDISFRGEQKKYGTFQNVYLTDEDIKELEEKIGSKVTNYIERLGAYMGSTGKTYKNHKMAILTWFFKDEGSHRKKSNVPTIEEYKRGDYL